MTEIICSGFGGQGVLTAGLILIEAGVAAGQQVAWSPSYGSEMRGGTANCNVIISDSEIGSPYIKRPDILVAMNEPSVDRFDSLVRPGGLILVNSSIIPKRPYPAQVRVFAVPATDIANETANPKGVNLVVLGALMEASGLFPKELMGETITRYFGRKGYDSPKNAECYRRGGEAVIQLQ
jgi:Pyruvate:ferredoxin oxidoreductase and related 2-oxoacid:ferredoxin oxidoreductases, gamma subunit